MPYRLTPFADVPLTEPLLRRLLAEHARHTRPRLERFWKYYRNAPEAGRPAPARSPHAPGLSSGGAPTAAALAQAAGLPVRLSSRAPDREIVIENDIAWRVHTMVEFMFGRPPRLVSQAADPTRARRIERVLGAVWEASGGIGLLQDLALMAHIYGHADLLLRIAPDAAPKDAGASDEPTPDAAAALAPELLRIELIEPTRSAPLISGSDYCVAEALVVTHRRRAPHPANDTPRDADPSAGAGVLARWLGRLGEGLAGAAADRGQVVTEIISATHRQLYTSDSSDADPRLVEDAPLPVPFPRPPVVHIQNLSQPFAWEGLGEVEPLIPLQDELNTRLSDRACRVTMQSFKMYLAKGIDGFEGVPVGPGRVWSTDNPDASIESFGGDAASPSEDRHIEEVREALDKISGVPPLATGVVRARIGNLTSENALRITLTGLLSRTARKRITYGRGLAEMSALVLSALDALGVLRTEPHERAVRVEWPDPLPKDERDQLESARLKRDLGVPAARVLAELGYGAGES